MSEYYEGVKEKEERVFVESTTRTNGMTVILVMPKSSGLAIDAYKSVQRRIRD